jgi:transposase InsO family protein
LADLEPGLAHRPEPKKKPKAAYIRFAAEQPNQIWRSDFHRLPAGLGKTAHSAPTWKSYAFWTTIPDTPSPSAATNQ